MSAPVITAGCGKRTNSATIGMNCDHHPEETEPHAETTENGHATESGCRRLVNLASAAGIHQIAANREILDQPRQDNNRRKTDRSARKDEKRQSQFLNGA